MIYMDEGFRCLYALFLQAKFPITNLELGEDKFYIYTDRGFIYLNYLTKRMEIVGTTIRHKDALRIPALGPYRFEIRNNYFIKEHNG